MRAIVFRAARGQTLIETAFFLPVILLVLFAIIYFSNLGIVYQRTMIVARYGANVGFGGSAGSPYSAAQIYTSQTTASGSCGSPPVQIFSNTGPFPGPTSAPYWTPEWASTSSSCSPITLKLVGAQFLASRYLTAGSVSVNAKSVMPGPLANLLPGIVAGSTSNQLNWVHPAWPSVILACTNKTAPVVQEALTAQGTSPVTTILPSPWPASCPSN